jgi:hypothetical protein
MKITPENISSLQSHEVFVFGSNESGIHGAGAARLAYDKFGAVWGVGVGKQGQTYAIPTKDFKIETLSLHIVEFYVDRFLQFAQINPKINFLVTAIGCGLAGYTVKDIAPLFVKQCIPDNVSLPQSFHNFYRTNS